MISDLKKSFSAILNERVSSPFYGALIVSWLVWNWKIVYLTIFISENTLKTDKITHIVDNYSDLSHLIIYPLLSTIFIVAIVPFFSNGSYWLFLIFNQWKINKQNEVQKKELLTLEQSIALREQIKSQEKRFEELLEDKNLRIKQLETEINLTQQSKSHDTKPRIDEAQLNVEKVKKNELNAISKLISEDNGLNATFNTLSWMVLHRYGLRDVTDAPKTKDINFFIANDIFEQDNKGVFAITPFGKKISKIILNKRE